MKTPESAIKLKNTSIKKSPPLGSLSSQLGNMTKITSSSNSLLRKVTSTTIKGNENGRTEKQIVQVPTYYTEGNDYVYPNPPWPDTSGYVADSEYVEI